MQQRQPKMPKTKIMATEQPRKQQHQQHANQKAKPPHKHTTHQKPTEKRREQYKQETDKRRHKYQEKIGGKRQMTISIIDKIIKNQIGGKTQ